MTMVQTGMYDQAHNNLQWVAEQAAEMFREHGSHMPLLHAYGERQFALVGMEFGNTDEKYAALRAAGVALAQIRGDIGRLTDVYMIAEAWMIRRGAVPVDGGDPPSQAPDRTEILGIMAWHLFPERHCGHRTEGTYYEVVREGQIPGQQSTDEGKILDLVRQNFNEEGGAIEPHLINELLMAYAMSVAGKQA